MSVLNNPLKQYFRRPAVYLKLPSQGKYYAEGVIDMPPTGELPVYPMTAIDEITSKTPDALFNGTAISDLMRSCIPDIKDPWAINSVDLDSILIAIKAAANGSNLELESVCPKCTNNATFGVDLIGVLATLTVGNYDEELDLGNLRIKFRPLTFKEMNEASLGQFEVQKIFAALEKEENMEVKAKHSQQALKDITELTIQILTNTIEYIKTPNAVVSEKEYILDFLRNCDKDAYTTIRDHNAQLRAAAELKPLDIKCISCGNEYKQPFTLNPTDFFG